MTAGTYFVMYFGGVHVLDGTMTPGQLVQFLAYAGMLYGPLGYVSRLPRMLVWLVNSLERLYDILDEEPDIRDQPDSEEHEIGGDVEFEGVSFGYKSYEPVLEGLDLSVKKGEMIGLVGPSGAGKSTVINLLMRLYNVCLLYTSYTIVPAGVTTGISVAQPAPPVNRPHRGGRVP